jgi:copper transport protein
VSRRPLVALFAAALLLVGAPVLLLAHQSLRRSEPAKDARLTTAPVELRLTFNEPADLGLTRVLLLGPAGDTIGLGPLTHAGDSTRVVVMAIRGVLRAGAYRVRWMTAGSDGHPTDGEFGFEILEGAAGVAEHSATADSERSDSLPAVRVADSANDATFGAASPAYVAIRWLLYLSMMLVIGAVAFRLLVVGAIAGTLGTSMRWLDDAAVRAARLALIAAAALVVATLLRLWAQTAAVRAVGLLLEADSITTLLTATAWGWGWLLQLAGAAIIIICLQMARRSPRAGGWTVAAVGALLLCVTPALSGHAVASARPAIAVTADALHVLGAGAWLGMLALVMLAGIPAALRLERSEREHAIADLVGAFSPAALAFASLVAATGVVAAWIHLGALTMLWESDYGRVLLVKLGVLSALAAVAAFNWRRVKPRLGEAAGTGILRRSATFEVTLAVVVLLVTAVLVALPTPLQR